MMRLEWISIGFTTTKVYVIKSNKLVCFDTY